MIATLKAIAKEYPDKVAKALYQEAQIELTEMKKRTPVDTGKLRGSLHTEQPEREGKKISIMFASGADVPYAVYVHEDLEAYHKNGEAKFMESVLKESAPYMAARIAVRVSLNDMGESKKKVGGDEPPGGKDFEE